MFSCFVSQTLPGFLIGLNVGEVYKRKSAMMDGTVMSIQSCHQLFLVVG